VALSNLLFDRKTILLSTKELYARIQRTLFGFNHHSNSDFKPFSNKYQTFLPLGYGYAAGEKLGEFA